MHAEYTIGCGPAPAWCAHLLSPYMRGDGGVGYEFRGALKDFSLCIGDVLILDGRIINVRRCASAYESEGFYAPDQKAGQDD